MDVWNGQLPLSETELNGLAMGVGIGGTLCFVGGTFAEQQILPCFQQVVRVWFGLN